MMRVVILPPETSPILSTGEGLKKYNTIIIATPLWWSQMASNMQTFLFKYGKEMEGKNIGLIVSSHSSGISGVEADAKRLVPNGKFYAKSLWINASKHSQRKALLEQWRNQLCIFFDSNSWEYTPIGKIEGKTKQQLKDAFGTGEVSITLSLDGATDIASVSANQAKSNSIYDLNGQKLAEVPATLLLLMISITTNAQAPLNPPRTGGSPNQ